MAKKKAELRSELEVALAKVKSIRLEELELALESSGYNETQAAKSKDKKRPHKKFAKREVKWEKKSWKEIDKQSDDTSKKINEMMKNGTIKVLGV